MRVRTMVDGREIRAVFDKPVCRTDKSSLSIRYDVDVSDTPHHVANAMVGIILSEHTSWSAEPIVFDELTEDELGCIDEHVRVNRVANSYGKCPKYSGANVIADSVVASGGRLSGGPLLCSNGMGKDGIMTSALARELGYDVRCFTVGIQYHDRSVWDRAQRCASGYYKVAGMGGNVIETSFMDYCFKVVPWWVFGVPLSYHYGSDVILSGHESCVSKTWSDSGHPYRYNASVFSFRSLTDGFGVEFANPLQSLDIYAALRLFIDRYPQYSKFRCTCMAGADKPCNKCAECLATHLLLIAMGTDPRLYGYGGKLDLGMKWNTMYMHTLDNAAKKIRGESFDGRIDQVNRDGLNKTWESDKLSGILLEHFSDYTGDPGSDRFGLSLCPSTWPE